MIKSTVVFLMDSMRVIADLTVIIFSDINTHVARRWLLAVHSAALVVQMLNVQVQLEATGLVIIFLIRIVVVWWVSITKLILNVDVVMLVKTALISAKRCRGMLEVSIHLVLLQVLQASNLILRYLFLRLEACSIVELVGIVLIFLILCFVKWLASATTFIASTQAERFHYDTLITWRFICHGVTIRTIL